MSARYSMRGRWPTSASMFGGLALQGSHTRKVMVSRLSRNSRRPSSKDMASSFISAHAPANFSSCHLKKYFPHGRHTTCSIRLLSTLILCDPSLLVSCPIPCDGLGLSRLPEWELAVTILVSTVPFLGMGSVLEVFLVGLALADRLPLSKRLTSSSSVPVKNPRLSHQALDSFLSL